jgi:hypothetical protein
VIPGNDERDPLDDWLQREIRPLPPPSGTFELITKRARRRKLGKLAVTVTSAATVAVATVFAVPAALSLHLGQSTATGAPVAVGGGLISTPASRSADGATNRAQGSAQPASQLPAQDQSSPAPTAGLPVGGAVPANFQPTSVTFIGPNIGWVIGPGGTPGTCANTNPTICTSVVLTQDGGQAWRGIHAPNTNAVTGIRFLNKQYGWAYGPQLWSTQDGGQDWVPVNTGTQQVIDLETAGSQAFALFANCAQGASASTVATNCSSYSLEASQAGSGIWSNVSGATTNLPDSAGATPSIVLSGTTGWLLAADGAIYSGPLGSPWTKLGRAPCSPIPAPGGGTGGALLTWDASTRILVAACNTLPPAGASAGNETVYTSPDYTMNWVRQPTLAPGATVTSLATALTAPAIVATRAGISILQGNTGQWVPAVSLTGGFSYVGMTSDTQGVAIPVNTALHEVYMTHDGGLSWIPRAITP